MERAAVYFFAIIIFSIIMDMCIIMFFIIFMSMLPIIWCIFISFSLAMSMLHIEHFMSGISKGKGPVPVLNDR